VEVFIGRVGQAATFLETFDNAVFHRTEHGDELRARGDIVRRRAAGQKPGVAGRQKVAILAWQVGDDAASGHGTKPFAYIALVHP
jgi:hypothetical protein